MKVWKQWEKKGLATILSVFTTVKDDLEKFIASTQEELDKLNDELIVKTRDHSKAKSTLTQVKKLLGDTND